MGIAVAQAGIGGAKLLYSLPAYGLIGAAALVSLFEKSKRVSVGARAACLGSAIVLAGYVLARSDFAPVDYLARHDFFMTLGALTVYLLSAVFLSECRQRLVFVVILLAYAAAHIVCGVYQFQSRDGQFMSIPWIVRENYAWRASGFYLSPNHLAGLLEALGLMAAALACWSNSRPIARIINGYAAMLCFIGVAITGSRGGYVSTVAGLLVFALLSVGVIRRLRPPRFWPMLAAVFLIFSVAIGGGVALMSKSQMLRERLGKVWEPDITRLEMWDAALKQFASSPLIGTGSGTYLFQGPRLRERPIHRDPTHVQNDYLELLCEYGIAGAVAMAVFLGVHVWSGFAGIRRIVAELEAVGWGLLNHELALVIGALSALAALLVHSVFDHNLHVPGNTLVVAFFLSILAAPTVETLLPDENAEPSVIVHWLRFLAPAIGLYLIVVGVPRVEGEYDAERAHAALLDAERANEMLDKERKRAASMDPEQASVVLLDAERAHAASVSEDYANAASFAEMGIAVEKKNPSLFYYLGKARYFLATKSKPLPADRFHEMHEVTGAFEAGLELFPDDLRLLIALGHALDEYGRFEEADGFFQRAIAVDPNFHYTHASYGLHFQMQNKMREALRHYRRAIELGEPANGLAAKALRAIQLKDELAREPSPADEEKW